jgi:acetyl-CoA acyltransferase
MRELREVYFVDGIRTAFGRAGPNGIFWQTRADDVAVKLVRGFRSQRRSRATPQAATRS